MKTTLMLILLCCLIKFSEAQTISYHENMEVIDSITSNTLVSNGNPAFNPNNAFHHDGIQSYLCTFGQGDVARATTDSFDLTGNTFVILKFWHICKIEFFDQAMIQVSIDGGSSWTNLTCTEYQGGSLGFCSQGNKFTEAAYPIWVPGTANIPDSTWWEEETFNISTIAANASNAKIRFQLKDLNNNGMSGRFGWLIDDVRVIAAPCELTPPAISLIPPILQGVVYGNGPYTYKVSATDASGIDTVLVSVGVNGATAVNYLMNNPVGDSIYTVTPPDTFAVGDTVCFSYTAYDATNCANSTTSQTFCFYISQGPVLPYCDDFEVNNTWIDSLVTGSSWELGYPNYGATSNAHAGFYAWDVSLNSAYLANTQSYLITPGFDFSNIGNATLKVWMNYYVQYGYDGVRIDYTTNAGVTWITLGSASDPNGTNWYNYANLQASSKPGWSGNSSGWKQASRNLIEPAFNLNGLPVQFRFAFNSNATTQYDGFTIDDFCLTIPTSQDVGVSNVVFSSAFYAVGANVTGKAVIKNYGSHVATNFNVNYKYNGIQGTPVNYTNVLAPGAEDTVYFNGIIIAQGTQSFCGYATLSADTNALNDTLCFNLTGVQNANITYCNDFEVNANDWSAINVTGNAQWESGTPNYGTTNTAHSGITAWDINLNSGYSGYSTAYLYSPYFDLTTACNAHLEFWQNRNTFANYDGARLEFSQNGTSWNTLGIYNDPLATGWYSDSYISSSGKPAWEGSSFGWIKCTYNLNAYNSTALIQLRFVFSSSSTQGGDGVSIDDFCIIQPVVNDAKVSAIVEPLTNLASGTTSPVRIKVKNYGCNPITYFHLYYNVNSGPVVGPVTYSGVLTANQTSLIVMPSMQVPLGVYDFCAWVVDSTDMNPANDTLCVSRKGLGVEPLDYWNHFDNANGNDFIAVNNIPGTSWELGTPNYGFTTGAYSGSSAWDINLNSGYSYNANCELLSPFFDFTTAVHAVLYFYQKRNIQYVRDGMHIEYSLNNGPWTVFGILNDPNAIRWYNHYNYYTGKPQWDGKNNGWRESKYYLNNFDSAGVMRFKFVFTSDYSYNLDGVSIDDFCILNAHHYDVGITNISNPNANGGYVIGNTYTPTVKIKNTGGHAVDTIPVVLIINGNYVTTQYYYPLLAPYDSAIYTFTGVNYSISQGTSTVCIYTDYPLDIWHPNDTMRTDLVGVDTIIPSYSNSFDSLNDGWTAYSIDALTKWELGTPAYGVTNNAHSPPSCWDINLSSAYHNNANCALYSPWFDFTNVVNAKLSFWINYKTQNIYDGTRLDYTLNGGASYSTLGAIGSIGTSNWYNNIINSSGKPGWTGNSNGWKLAVDSNLGVLNAISNPVRFKFIFTSSPKIGDDGFSIDDFSLYCPIVTSAGINNLSANKIFTPGLHYFSTDFSNTGNGLLNNVVLVLKIDSTIIASDTLNTIPGGPLVYGQQSSHLFSMPYNAVTGQHTICSYTSYPNGVSDNFPADDTLCNTVTMLDSTSVFPYCNDFESGTNWLSLNAINYNITGSWQLGDPNKNNLYNAHSGIKTWITKLTGYYPNLDNSVLVSIVFNIDSGNCYNLSFWHKYLTQGHHDGGLVEYSRDSSNTWEVLGAVNDPVNWMNDTNVAALNNSGWSGTEITWAQSSHIFTSYQTGTVIFRWRFASDATIGSDGWQIDDVCFEQIAAPCYLGLDIKVPNDFFLYQNIPNPTTGATEISFKLPRSGNAILEITDVLGQIVNVPINQQLHEGKHVVTINAGVLPAGVYNYALKFEGKQLKRMMVIMK